MVGAGRAAKEQIGMMVRILLAGCEIASTDATEALTMAICRDHHAATGRAWSDQRGAHGRRVGGAS